MILNVSVSGSANVPSILAAATVAVANTNRSGFSIQNQGTSPLPILLGSGATSTLFHVVLQGGTAQSDGKGGIYSQIGGVVYQGIITQSGSNPMYTYLEF